MVRHKKKQLNIRNLGWECGWLLHEQSVRPVDIAGYFPVQVREVSLPEMSPYHVFGTCRVAWVTAIYHGGHDYTLVGRTLGLELLKDHWPTKRMSLREQHWALDHNTFAKWDAAYSSYSLQLDRYNRMVEVDVLIGALLTIQHKVCELYPSFRVWPDGGRDDDIEVRLLDCDGERVLGGSVAHVDWYNSGQVFKALDRIGVDDRYQWGNLRPSIEPPVPMPAQGRKGSLASHPASG